MRRKLLTLGLFIFGILQAVYVLYAILHLTQSLKWDWDKGLLNIPTIRNDALIGFGFSYIALIVLSVFVFKDFRIAYKLISTKDHKYNLKPGLLIFLGNIAAIILLLVTFSLLLWYHCQRFYC